MAFTLTMPKLSPTMDAGTLVQWHKKEGDLVEVGDLLFEVATDKATVEYMAIDEGYLRKILVKEKGEAYVNQPVAIFSVEKNEDISKYKPEGEESALAAVAAEKEGESQGGSKSTPAPTPTASVMPTAAFEPAAPLEDYTFEFSREKTFRKKASPLAKKLAKEQGLDLDSIQGSGPGGRVMERDLEKASKGSWISFSRAKAPTEKPGSYEEKSLSPMRKAIATRLSQSKTYIPHFYISIDVDAAPMSALRAELKKGELNLTFNDFVMRAVALALKKHPEVNTGYNSVTEKIIEFKTIDIAVAVSIPEGLITPIIRHCDYKNMGEISAEVKALAKRAKEGTLEPQEYQGGSFTVSNLGMYGISQFQAILNPPQAAILAVAGIRDVPVVKDEQVVPGKVMTLTLSCDHRVIDGALAAQFLASLKTTLESPALLLV